MTKIKTSVAALALVAAAGMGAVGLAQDKPEEPHPAPAPAPKPPAKSDAGLATHSYYVGDILFRDGGEADGSAMQPLIELITSTIAPETWAEGDGPGPSIKPFLPALSLTVRHDRTTHERIGVLLGLLRRMLDSRNVAEPAPPPPAGGTPTTRIAPHAPVAKGEGSRPRLVNRSYPIGDLIGLTPGPVDDPDVIPDAAWSIVDRISKSIAPASWMGVEGAGWARPFYARALGRPSEDGTRRVGTDRNLSLLVRQTVEVQDRVKVVLDDLRRGQNLLKPAP